MKTLILTLMGILPLGMFGMGSTQATADASEKLYLLDCELYAAISMERYEQDIGCVGADVYNFGYNMYYSACMSVWN